MSISVIIPLSWGEQSWKELLSDLKSLPPGSEIIFALPKGAKSLEVARFDPSINVREISEGMGRAAQMNAAARIATGSQLWFIHADTRVSSDTVRALFLSLTRAQDRLHYADLKFLSEGVHLMKINEIGTWVRSRFLGMPFGDQGICIQKNLFYKIGAYLENLPYGEDHVFVWRARQSGIALKSIGAPIYTSARKYREQGWFRTTVQHVVLTYMQAWPEFWRLVWRGAP
jgi:hypothetical protein